MESSVSLVITAIVLVLLVIILPVYNVFTRQDDMSYNVILKATANLVDTVRTTGYLDLDMYQQFMNEIQATHNTFEVELEGYKKRAVLIDSVYNDVEIIDYTDDILKVIESGKKQYKLEKGERFYVRVRNTNITKADTLLHNIKIFDAKSKIDIDYGGVVLVNTIKK